MVALFPHSSLCNNRKFGNSYKCVSFKSTVMHVILRKRREKKEHIKQGIEHLLITVHS